MNPNDSIRFLVGSYTDGEGVMKDCIGAGVSLFELDQRTGEAHLVSQLGGLHNPSYLALDQEHPELVHVACEAMTHDGEVASIRVTRSGEMAVLSKCGSRGVASCHVLVHRGLVFATAYTSGRLAVLPLKNGSISDARQVIQYVGKGPNTARQEGPHAHHTAVAPDGESVYICDLGSDTIWRHRFLHGSIDEAATPALRTPGGAGPRHLLFHPGLPLAYVVCELDNTILVCDWNHGDGLLSPRQIVPALRPDDAPSSGAAIRIHPSGRALYASFRGADVITTFRLADNGLLEDRSISPCGGRSPRDFTIDPTGKWMIVAHQHSNTLATFAIDPKTLEPTSNPASVLPCGTPVAVLFLPQNLIPA